MKKKITTIAAEKAGEQRKKTRVAAYCRVSTDSDEQLISLDAQKAHYSEYIRANDAWEYAGLYYDEGVTGTKKEIRSGLMALIADCENGLIDLVITKSISRFARNTADCLEMVRKLTNLGVFIYFEKENIHTEKMESELMLSILASMAESESLSISENNKWSIRNRFEKGTFIISYPPYGYENVDGRMVVVPEQAEVVKEIFESCLAGMGTHLIARKLNEKGIKTKKGSSQWHASTVNSMLTNEKYTGDVIFQKTFTDSGFVRHTNYGERDMFLCENHHEAIISHETFDKVREVLDRRAMEKGNGENTSRYQNRYAFSGRIKCGCCGGTFKRRQHYKPSGNYIAWACETHIANKNDCPMLYVEDEPIKAAFTTMLNKLVFGHQQILKPMLRSLRGMDDKERLLQIERLERKREENADRKQTLATLMAEGLLDAPIFSSENQALILEEASLKNEKDQLMNAIGGDRVKAKELQKLMEFTAKGQMLTEFDDDLFTTVVESITVKSREQIVIRLKCGLGLQERLVK